MFCKLLRSILAKGVRRLCTTFLDVDNGNEVCSKEYDEVGISSWTGFQATWAFERCSSSRSKLEVAGRPIQFRHSAASWGQLGPAQAVGR